MVQRENCSTLHWKSSVVNCKCYMLDTVNHMYYIQYIEKGGKMKMVELLALNVFS